MLSWLSLSVTRAIKLFSGIELVVHQHPQGRMAEPSGGCFQGFFLHQMIVGWQFWPFVPLPQGQMYMFKEAFKPHLITLVVELTSSLWTGVCQGRGTCKVRKPCCWSCQKNLFQEYFSICNYSIKNAFSPGEVVSERSRFVVNTMSCLKLWAQKSSVDTC